MINLDISLYHLDFQLKMSRVKFFVLQEDRIFLVNNLSINPRPLNQPGSQKGIKILSVR
jgi:hypothetical protein